MVDKQDVVIKLGINGEKCTVVGQGLKYIFVVYCGKSVLIGLYFNEAGLATMPVETPDDRSEFTRVVWLAPCSSLLKSIPVSFAI